MKSHARQGFQLAAVQVLKIRTIFSQRGEKGTGGERKRGEGPPSRGAALFPVLGMPSEQVLH